MGSSVQVVVIAGRLATRLGDLARTNPKSLIKIVGKPFLEHQIDFLKAGRATEVVLCLGHSESQTSEYFGDCTRFGVDIQYSVEDRPPGTAGVLNKEEAILDDVIFTYCGNSNLFGDHAATSAYFAGRNRPGLMTEYLNDAGYLRGEGLH